MCVSLADPGTLVVALGANLPGRIGSPRQTLEALRPELQAAIADWLKLSITDEVSRQPLALRWRWSPLFETRPVGGPAEQPKYLNAVLVVDGPAMGLRLPSELAALALLERLHSLEAQFGRNRAAELERWGPRCLDLDLLAWDGLQIQHPRLTLPHPRLLERSFVLAPLLAAINTSADQLQRLDPQPGWPE